MVQLESDGERCWTATAKIIMYYVVIRKIDGVTSVDFIDSSGARRCRSAIGGRSIATVKLQCKMIDGLSILGVVNYVLNYVVRLYVIRLTHMPTAYE